MDEKEIGRILVEAAILPRLRLAHRKLGFLLHFGAAVRKEGRTRTGNGLEADR